MNTQKSIEYLSKKLDFVYQTYSSFENNLSEDTFSLANSGLSEQDMARGYNYLEYISGNIFRQAMLIMICSFLEEAMDLIGEEAISDYPAKIGKKTKENWFEKRKKLFQEVGVSFKEIEEECERISDLRIVRNCIVHAGGRIEKYRYPAQVEEAVTRLKERDKEKNLNLVEITADKFLNLGDNIVTTAIIASEQIIKQCSKATSGKA